MSNPDIRPSIISFDKEASAIAAKKLDLSTITPFEPFYESILKGVEFALRVADKSGSLPTVEEIEDEINRMVETDLQKPYSVYQPHLLTSI